MKAFYFFIGFTLGIVIAVSIYSSNLPSKTLILPEEICQASKGDHMQLYSRNDTSFLEYTFASKPMPVVIQGQQFTIGEDIDYKQDDEISVDTLRKVEHLANMLDSLVKLKK